MWAQGPTGPVVNPRGVVNPFTQMPAPTAVAPGGILWIDGLNLGPVEGARASGLPWPTRLGEVEVTINGRAAPIFSVSQGRVVVQVPWATPVGVGQVVVRRGGASRRPARVEVRAIEPGVRTQADRGYGPVAGVRTGNLLTFSASGLGETEPKVGDGEGGSESNPVRPREEVRAYVGGLPAKVEVALSADRAGEFDVRLEVPSDALPGDPITLSIRNRAANRPTLGSLAKPETVYLPLPEGARNIQSLVDSDLRGAYLIASADRDDQGCWPSFQVDFGRKWIGRIEACLTAANRNALSPVMAPPEGASLGALVGPPEGDAQTGVSSKMMIFSPSKAEPVAVELPFAASMVSGGEGGDFLVAALGAPARAVFVDAETGEVRDGPILIQTGSGAQGGFLFTGVDLGAGLSHVLSMPVASQQGILVLVGDDPDNPVKAKLALYSLQGELLETRDMPEGWAPLIGPQAQQQPGGGVTLPGGGAALPGAGQGQTPVVQPAVVARPRASVFMDTNTRTFYVVARTLDDSKHGLVAFAGDTVKTIPFPASWFAAACAPNIPIFNFELSRKITVFGSNTGERQFRNPCPALGYLVLDLADQSLAAIPLPGQGQFNAAGNIGDLNDYLYGTNTDPARRGTSDTLYVLDGVSSTPFRLDLPSEVTNFANLQPVRSRNLLIGPAIAGRAVGDGGLVVFDLERADRMLLPTPEGFSDVTLVDVFTSTGKVVARGTRRDGAGSQYLIWDLADGDLEIVPNPPGVTWVGVLPAALSFSPGELPQRPRQLQTPNPKANTVAAGCFDDKRELVGLMLLRVP